MKPSRNEMAEYDRVRAIVAVRSDGYCELRGSRCTGRAKDFHHVIYRSNGGSDTVKNLKHVCGSCHSAIHNADKPLGKEASSEFISNEMARKIKW